MNTKLLTLFKDHRILKLSFVLLTMYFLFGELVLFFSTKPTLTTQLQTKLQSKHSPEALICSSPAFDQEELSSLGYEHSHDYILGVIDGDLLRGWSGREAGNQSMENILHRISVIKSEDDCPSVKVKFQNNGKIIKSKLAVSLTRPMYPHGRCCKMKISTQPEDILHQIYFRIYPAKFENKKIQSFKMFLSDPDSSSPFHESKMTGETLETGKLTEVFGYHLYKVKIHEEVQLEDNPNYSCRQYLQPGDYDRCLESEFSQQISALLSCTPPWLTDQELSWCRHTINVSEETSKQVNFFLENLSFGKAEAGPCQSPCKTAWQVSPGAGEVQ